MVKKSELLKKKNSQDLEHNQQDVKKVAFDSMLNC